MTGDTESGWDDTGAGRKLSRVADEYVEHNPAVRDALTLFGEADRQMQIGYASMSLGRVFVGDSSYGPREA
jgi:hypothetical protein